MGAVFIYPKHWLKKQKRVAQTLSDLLGHGHIHHVVSLNITVSFVLFVFFCFVLSCSYPLHHSPALEP